MPKRSRSKIPFVEKKVRRLAGRAVERYGLINAEDRILVALSGGVDSTSLLWLLHDRLSRIPITYKLFAVHVDLGFEGEDYSAVQDWVESFLCSRLRRAALFKEAGRLECNKIAFGHNLDDLIETFLINIFYGSQLSTMLPRQPFFGGEITIIRPFSLLDTETISRFHKKQGLPLTANPCPSKKTGKRQEIREILQGLYRKNRKIRGNILAAMHNVNLEYLPSYEHNHKR